MALLTETQTSAYAEQWSRLGYVFVPAIYSPERTARLRLVCDRILAHWRAQNPETGKPGGDENANCMRHLNHSGYFKNHPDEFPEIMSAVADPAVLDVARTILGEEPLFRCTSYFFSPMGTSQDGNWHRDSQFMIPDIEEEKKWLTNRSDPGNSVQIQIALAPSEDVEYVPASHSRWDTSEEFQIRRADQNKNWCSNNMPGALRFKQNPGDAVLFNPIGLHRGRYHTDKLRRTLMLTYTSTTAPCFDYFSTQPWFLEPHHLDALDPQTRVFFQKFVDVYRERWMTVGSKQ
jgi:hypothetical protein